MRSQYGNQEGVSVAPATGIVNHVALHRKQRLQHAITRRQCGFFVAPDVDGCANKKNRPQLAPANGKQCRSARPATLRAPSRPGQQHAPQWPAPSRLCQISHSAKRKARSPLRPPQCAGRAPPHHRISAPPRSAHRAGPGHAACPARGAAGAATHADMGSFERKTPEVARPPALFGFRLFFG